MYYYYDVQSELIFNYKQIQRDEFYKKKKKKQLVRYRYMFCRFWF